jgi:curved DNA-binding protein CbpA
MEDPYKVLGVERSATPEQIKIAWRRLCADNHPDRKGGDPALMADINAAYKLLSDLEARERYNATGSIKAPSPLDVRARERLMTMFQGAFDAKQDDEDCLTDLFMVVAQMIAGTREGIKVVRAECTKKIRRLRTAVKRVRRRGEGENFIVWWLEQQVSDIETNMERMENEEILLNRVEEMLADFSWIAWEPPPVDAPLLVQYAPGYGG